MSGGETLLLLPAYSSLGPLPWKASMGSARRCLFGRPDAVPKTDDVSDDSERMKRQWDFDIIKEKPVYPPRRFLWEEVGAAASTESRKRSRVTPYKQLRITDFWRTRKFDGFNKKKSSLEQCESSSESSSSE